MVKALYPSDYESNVLTNVTEDKTERVQALDIENKYVIYPGCSSFAAVRRWPYYMELIEKLGIDNVIVVGGIDDLNKQYAYIYKKLFPILFPHQFTNRKSFWRFCKSIKLLKPYAHNTDIEKLDVVILIYLNGVNWFYI